MVNLVPTEIHKLCVFVWYIKKYVHFTKTYRELEPPSHKSDMIFLFYKSISLYSISWGYKGGGIIHLEGGGV